MGKKIIINLVLSLGAVTAGVFLSWQSPVNGRLRQDLNPNGDSTIGILAAFLSFCASLFILCAVCLLQHFLSKRASATLADNSDKTQTDSTLQNGNASTSDSENITIPTSDSAIEISLSSSADPTIDIALTKSVDDVLNAPSNVVITTIQPLSLPPSDGCTKSRPYEYIAGLLGALVVTAALLLGPEIGFATYTVLNVTSQICVSLTIDHWGILGVLKSKITIFKVGAAATCLIGAIMCVAENIAAANDADNAEYYILCLVSMLVGAIVPFQATLNWRLGHRLNNKLHSSTVNFIVGTIGLGLISGIVAIATSMTVSVSGADWLLFAIIGGGLGAVYIFLSVMLSGRLGMAIFFTALITGQLLGSTIADAVGVLGFKQQTPSVLRVFGLIITATAAALLQVAKSAQKKGIGPREAYQWLSSKACNPNISSSYGNLQ